MSFCIARAVGRGHAVRSDGRSQLFLGLDHAEAAGNGLYAGCGEGMHGHVTIVKDVTR